MANLRELIPAFFTGADGKPLSPEEIKRRRQVAESLLAQATDTSPNAGGGASVLAKAIQGLSFGINEGRMDRAAAANAERSAERIRAMLGGGEAVGGMGAGLGAGSVNPGNTTSMATMPAPDTASARVAQGHGGGILPPTFQSILDKTEGGGDYDTLFGHSQKSGPFAGTSVSSMTIADALAFSDPSGPYAQWVKQRVGRVATPMGRHQIVGTTLRNAVKELGLDPSAPFNAQTQDMIAMHLAKRRVQSADTLDGKINALRSEWEGFKNVPREQLAQVVQEIESAPAGGMMPEPSVASGMTDEDVAASFLRMNPGTSAAPVSPVERAPLAPIVPPVAVAETPEEILAAEAAMAGDPAFTGTGRGDRVGAGVQTGAVVTPEYAEQLRERFAAENAGSVVPAAQPGAVVGPDSLRLERERLNAAMALPNMGADAAPGPVLDPVAAALVDPAAAVPAVAATQAAAPASAPAVDPVAAALTGYNVDPDVPMMGVRDNTQGFAPVQAPAAAAPTGQMAMAGGAAGINPAVVEALADPNASAEEKQIAGMLYQQYLAQQDPYKQLQRRKLELEVAGLANPTAKLQQIINVGNGTLYDPNNDRFITAPNSGQPKFRMATPEEAAQYGAPAGQFGPDGRFYPINPPSGMTIESDGKGGFRLVQGAGVGKGGGLREQESKDLVYLTRAQGAAPTIDKYGAALTDAVQGAMDYDPTGVVRGRQSPEYQLAKQAGREFLTSILRKDTGAAITTSEEQIYGAVYLPQPGDGPEVLEQKKLARARALEAIKNGLPPDEVQRVTENLYNQSLINKIEREGGSSGVLPVGYIDSGYRYKGGDPAKPESWEEIKYGEEEGAQ